ncbi:helix-turn-helix transcriptional regulator [Streptomyces pactum]|uniref:Helix-turn-helix transcriptional regulator n=1 Tax=Streptomyces pactum TaxID=68249 RepID=A0ABS0NIR1_9ACTN|nr:helix-turn-helix transcriptional regulator [Streptomyces pactum]MBH5335085.1 helix-turn-helix transcriptional regulator [Streptomyces pactum]
MTDRTRPGEDGAAGGGDGGDPLDQTLRAVRELIESTVAEHRARRSRNRLVTEVGVDDAGLREAAERLAVRARYNLELVLPCAGGRTSPVHTALAGLLDLAAPAVAVRALCAQPPPGWETRGEVRTAKVALPALVIADSATALICAESPAGRQTSLVRDPAVARTLHSLFGSVWGGATPVAGPFDFGNRARADMVRRVLERLRDGVTDEAAARELSVSVRTYRRYVTHILELLGASSRFQAGVRATELGILRDR